MQVSVGQIIQRRAWHTAAGPFTTIPDPHDQMVNLQFSRFAGCPICNLHLASYRKRAAELQQAGIKVVIVFHSPAGDVADLRGDLPFALVPDPDRRYYREFGVGRSPFSLLNSVAFATLRSEAKAGRRAQRVHGGPFGLPADFVIDQTGKVIVAHYGKHADDTLSVDDVLAAAMASRRDRAQPMMAQSIAPPG